ncbi:MAG: hypothetical protein ACYC8T_28250 [Myxococcaceae bacterium]
METAFTVRLVECPCCYLRTPEGHELCPGCLGALPRWAEPSAPVGVQGIPVARAVPPPPEPETFSGPLPGMFDLILRGRRRLNALMRDEGALPGVTQKLLLLSLLGLAVHGLAVGLAAQLLPGEDPTSLYRQGHPLLWMPLASMLAFVGALCICLPSFYFYTQLSGLDASFRLVTAQALRAQATTSVLLLGVLPFYAAWVLACVLGLYRDSSTVLLVGLCLPFGVGLLGVHAIYQAFSELARHLPVTHARRGNFLRRMVLGWGAVYSVVAPVALVRLAQALGKVI